MNISSSPKRGTFQAETHLKKLETEPNDEEAMRMVNLLEEIRIENSKRETESEWAINNMEYDLRSTQWILDKVRADKAYAQNLYAAMCNNEFQHNEVWPILKGELWGCSWRHAGGIIADMRQQGDYIDWYCSGIREKKLLSTEDISALDFNGKIWYEIMQRYVPESVITDEIRSDLLTLGWIAVEESSETD